MSATINKRQVSYLGTYPIAGIHEIGQILKCHIHDLYIVGMAGITWKISGSLVS